MPTKGNSGTFLKCFFFFYNFFFDIFLLHKLSVLVNHSPQSSCKLVLNQELTCLSALVKIMYLFC